MIGKRRRRRPVLADDPIGRVDCWLAAAMRAGARQPEAMALATANASGVPSVRYMLLRGIDRRGFVFYTDGRSRKGAEVAVNARAALAFHWDETGRQIRVEGRVEHVEPETVDAYWAARARGKRLAAATSTQSRTLESRARLLDRFRRLRERYRSREIPRPGPWTGLRVVPDAIEFWTRGAERLHHRELFVRRRGAWRRTLLEP